MASMVAVMEPETRSREELIAELRRVELRLEAGYRKIEDATASGQNVTQWETIWLRLLDDYERIYDRLVA
jgi:hypothetical protein